MQSLRDFEAMHNKVVKDKESRDTKYGCTEDEYVIKHQLGKGAFGAVYKVKAK